jgi:replicative DNA helicase
MVVLDYLQLMSAGGSKFAGNRVMEVSEMSRSLKEMAKDLKVPIVVLSQLSRAVEQRVDKEPQLSDLRDSGAIEQDADSVMMIYREEYYDPDTDKK